MKIFFLYKNFRKYKDCLKFSLWSCLRTGLVLLDLRCMVILKLNYNNWKFIVEFFKEISC